MTGALRAATAILFACLVAPAVLAGDEQAGKTGQQDSPGSRFNPSEFTFDKTVPAAGPAVLPEVNDDVIIIFEQGDRRRPDAPAGKKK